MRIFLFLLLLTSISTGQIVTSPNLLPQNFTTANGWSGSNLTSNHGTSVIAGVNGQDVQYTYSLNNLLNKSQINSGFISTAGADLYFWNNYNQNVVITQTLVNDNNISLTQNRVVPNNGQYINYMAYTDSIIVGTNSASNYNITVNYAFNVPGTTGHVGADLKSPTLYIAYESNPVVISTATTASLQQTTSDLNSVKIGTDGKVIPYTNSLTGQVYGNTLADVYSSTTTTPITSTTNITGTSVTGSSTSITGSSTSITGSSTSITGSSTNTVENKPVENTTSTSSSTPVESKTETQTSASTSTEQKTETKTEESKTDSKSETKTETTSNKQENKTQVASTNVSNKDNKQNINIQVKDINSLKIETQQTLSNMIDNRMIDVYSVPFYKSAKIYENQIQLADNKIIYPGVSLKAYLAKDLLAKRSIQLAEIREEKKQLLIDLEVLRDAK